MIREATLDDVAELVALGVRFMRESRYSAYLSLDASAQASLAQMLIREPHGLVLVDERKSRIIGMIGVLATIHPYSGDRIMSELFWYVAPEARGAGVRLLLEAEHWAIKNGIRKSMVTAPEVASQVASLYQRLGYVLMERQYIKDLL